MLRVRTVLICFLCLASIVGRAQTQKAASPAQSTADTNTDNSEEPDAPVTQSVSAEKGDAASMTSTAWDMLRTALSDSKAQAHQARIDAITALGTLGQFAQAQKLLRDTAQDSDRYLRFAAVAAMGAGKDHVFIPDLKAALKDNAPEVSFAAAVGLWKMNDRSGESILYAVLAGDRKVKQGAVGSGLHQGRSGSAQPIEVGGDWRRTRSVRVAGTRRLWRRRIPHDAQGEQWKLSPRVDRYFVSGR